MNFCEVLEMWRRAAFLKIRTWEAIQERHRAGESLEELAVDYAVPFELVRSVCFPENDLDARYGRPSDRVKTAKANLLAAELEIIDLRRQLDTCRSRMEWVEL